MLFRDCPTQACWYGESREIAVFVGVKWFDYQQFQTYIFLYKTYLYLYQGEWLLFSDGQWMSGSWEITLARVAFEIRATAGTEYVLAPLQQSVTLGEGDKLQCSEMLLTSHGLSWFHGVANLNRSLSRKRQINFSFYFLPFSYRKTLYFSPQKPFPTSRSGCFLRCPLRNRTGVAFPPTNLQVTDSRHPAPPRQRLPSALADRADVPSLKLQL